MCTSEDAERGYAIVVAYRPLAIRREQLDLHAITEADGDSRCGSRDMHFRLGTDSGAWILQTWMLRTLLAWLVEDDCLSVSRRSIGALARPMVCVITTSPHLLAIDRDLRLVVTPFALLEATSLSTQIEIGAGAQGHSQSRPEQVGMLSTPWRQSVREDQRAGRDHRQGTKLSQAQGLETVERVVRWDAVNAARRLASGCPTLSGGRQSQQGGKGQSSQGIRHALRTISTRSER